MILLKMWTKQYEEIQDPSPSFLSTTKEKKLRFWRKQLNKIKFHKLGQNKKGKLNKMNGKKF